MKLTVVIPALNAADQLADAISSIQGDGIECIVIDGGSTDDTAVVAERCGAQVVKTGRGRGLQLATGGCLGSADWLLFLHADTVLSPDWHQIVEAYISNPNHAERAACFGFALDSLNWQARVLEKLVNFRSRCLGLPYGDQGFLVARQMYRSLGGYRPIPLMEDVDIVRRVGRRRLDVLVCSAKTSAMRWHKDGWFLRSMRNLMCLCLYGLGVRPQTLVRLYR